MRIKSFFKDLFEILKESFKGFSDDKVLKLSGSLAYTMVFSIGPLLLIIITVSSAFFGREAIEGTIYSQLQGFLGKDTALQLQDIIKHAAISGKSSVATVVGIIALVILQIFIAQEYNTIMLYITLSVSYGLWIVTLGLLAKAFFSWYKLRKNLMVLIFALSMVAYVINGVFGLYSEVDGLAKRSSMIRTGDVAIFPESPSSINDVYQIASSVGYVLTWIATVMLLRPYIEKLGKLKFWSIMGVTMVYYLISFPLFSLGYFTPSENSNAMTNILIFSLSAIFTGILFGVAFLSVARTLKIGTPARNYMIIAAYGFLLFYIAGSAFLSQAAYPPYGLISVSITGLSCYLIYNGLYFSAISVSQDMTLRQSIRKSVMEQSKLLDSMGSAEMERELQKQVLTVAKKTSAAMADKSGVEASLKEDEMKSYMEFVMNELKSKRIS